MGYLHVTNTIDCTLVCVFHRDCRIESSGSPSMRKDFESYRANYEIDSDFVPRCSNVSSSFETNTNQSASNVLIIAIDRSV